MIIKNFELGKIKSKNLNFFLFYGENEGFKDEKIKQVFINDFKGSVEKFEESEVLNNTDRFISSIINKSFFEEKKIIIISRVSDKIANLIKDLLDRGANDTIIILNSGNLEKKSNIVTSPKQSSSGIPKYVADRMARRIFFTTGIPTIMGMSVFVVSYIIVTRNIAEIPPSSTIAISALFFLIGLAGLSFGILSASWDKEPGSFFGIENIPINIKRAKAAFKPATQNFEENS